MLTGHFYRSSATAAACLTAVVWEVIITISPSTQVHAMPLLHDGGLLPGGTPA